VAETLLEDVAPEDLVDDRLAVRASALELALRSATALVAATGGAAMSLDAAPQRLAREAVFYLVQAQTPPGARGRPAAVAGLRCVTCWWSSLEVRPRRCGAALAEVDRPGVLVRDATSSAAPTCADARGGPGGARRRRARPRACSPGGGGRPGVGRTTR
jgi:hypothetical protein